MKSDQLREKMLAAEIIYLRSQIVDQLCRWHLCRNYTDLRLALSTVGELVDIEDCEATA